MGEPIRIFIADDHAIVRSGLRALLATEPEIEVVGDAANGEQAVTGVKERQPDVVLMDLEMPGMDGIEAIRQIIGADPEARILVLTGFATDERVFPAIQAGALGYILKDAGPEALVQAIRQVYRGESSLHPKIARKLIEEMARPVDQPPTADPLTPREVEVLQLVAKGMSNQEIAGKLVIGEATVRSHVNNILRKLHLASRTQAALYALREGYASLGDS
ncbi:MAG TPA: response regulator transcription factor [Anaerolineales bacterium]|nr:response regulator transcription factor [Anaerolineales bacterium]